MSGFQIQRIAGHRLDEIFVYTRDKWGVEQAECYINGMFSQFEAIAAKQFPWRVIPAEFEVEGFVCKYEQHFIYWKILSDGTIGIVTILHERMHQIHRFKNDLG
jgi:toxin ParE1/3/4